VRTLVVTAADETYLPLLRGLLGSLRQWSPPPFAALACFDLGLQPASRDWVADRVDHLAAPGWDLPVAPELRTAKPHWRGLTVRPFLRDYFPGYELYLWVDADAWVQERYALEWYAEAARGGDIALATERDAAYAPQAAAAEWRAWHMSAYFGPVAAARSALDAYGNAGVFALKAAAPHWALWAEYFRAGLAATGGAICCDQTALNYLLWSGRAGARFLPGVCNWLCHLGAPGYSRALGKFCEPAAPYRPLGILHLTGHARTQGIVIEGAGVQSTLGARFPGDV
jgi:hypothetical protein